jgi:hypothetical protein
MSIRDLFIAGLDPSDPSDRFAFVSINGDGIPVIEEREGREYRILWSDDLAKDLEEWVVWKAYGQEMPATAPENTGRIFYRLEVRLRE